MSRIERILFPVDFSDRSQAAAPFVLSMAQRYKAHVTTIHALQPPIPLYAGINTLYPEVYDYAALTEDIRGELHKFASAELPKVEVTHVVEMGDPAAVITDYSEQHGISLIAMPTHGYGGFRRALLGSVTAKVLHDTKIPVWTDAHAPEPSHRAHPQPRYVLCAVDLRAESAGTLEYAVELAGDAEASVELVHIAPEGEATPLRIEGRLHELLKKTNVQERAEGDQVEVVTNAGSVAEMIRDIALRKRADLVVIGRGAIQAGSHRLRTNAYAIVREAPCPVISV